MHMMDIIIQLIVSFLRRLGLPLFLMFLEKHYFIAVLLG